MTGQDYGFCFSVANTRLGIFPTGAMLTSKTNAREPLKRAQ
jgi:hypothetical protein